MSSSSKYAGLLDISEAPDIYATPDLTDSTSTNPPSTSRPTSPSTSDIDRHGLNPDEARSHFLPSGEVDAHGSRISIKRKGYHSSSKWRRRDGLEVNGDQLSSDEEEEEGLERKLARLKREVAEVKGEVERRRTTEAANKGAKQETNEAESREVEALTEVLDSVGPTTGLSNDNAATRLSKQLAAASLPTPAAAKPTPASSNPQSSASTTYTLTYAPTYNPTHTLSKITSFDTRLSALESALGLTSFPLPTQTPISSSPNTTTIPKPVLYTLDTLDAQLRTLNTITTDPTALDSTSRRIRHLLQDAQALDSARNPPTETLDPIAAAAAAAGEANSTATSTPSPNPALTDPDNLAKLHALYGTLPTIESLAPLLPATLDRLRALRALHADAAGASERLRGVEERQGRVREEMKRWREGLERVEGRVREGEERWAGNVGVVEGWVRELEGRVEGLERGGKGEGGE